MDLTNILSAIKDLGIPVGIAVSFAASLVWLYVKRVTTDADARVDIYKEQTADLKKEIAELKAENAHWRTKFERLLDKFMPATKTPEPK